MPTHHFIVLTKAKDGRQEEFDRWYDDRHLGDLMAVPEVVKATRYRVVHQEDSPQATPRWSSVALYEIDSDEPKAVIKRIALLSGTDAMPASDALDFDAVLQLLGEHSRTCV